MTRTATSAGLSVSRVVIRFRTSAIFDFGAETISRLAFLSGQMRTRSGPPGGAPPDGGAGDGGEPPGGGGEPLGDPDAEGPGGFSLRMTVSKAPSSSASE